MTAGVDPLDQLGCRGPCHPMEAGSKERVDDDVAAFDGVRLDRLEAGLA